MQAGERKWKVLLSAGTENPGREDVVRSEIRVAGLVAGEPCAHMRTVCLNSSRGHTKQVKCHHPPEESLVSASLFLKDSVPGKTAGALPSSHKDPVAKSRRGNCLTCRLFFGTCDCVRHYKQVGPAKLAYTTMVSPGSFPFCLLSILAFTLISPSITNIQHSCERFSRESDAGSPCSVTTGMLIQPSSGAMHSAPPAAG